MKTILYLSLLLAACNGSAPSEPKAAEPKIAAPQREVLENARGVEQTLLNAGEAQQKKIDDAEAK